MATKRLMKEYNSIQKALSDTQEYENIVSLEPTGDLFSWCGVIRGPSNSPFQAGTWKIKIEVPQNYPIAPPKMKFVNKLCHPNVNFQTGEICLDILQNQWTPAWTLLTTMSAILLLLQDPEPTSPLNIDISNLLKSGDIKAYNGLIRFYTHKYAIDSV
ncbi:E2 ubiquitin-protein ligase peroxin 4 [Cyberlindnera jadinii NRRL Y-1542]|uniref:Ubiquitin-conjugating enzyme E2 n=1 Tax=Cyberlindnera jadinii (strain ATCC 18201 / CBS 1600 / BCRC 20928 / JCM 3617 / NBRC 0987 / NRRL Y-1542) TaxID=983966 RepID=A0A1E4RY80_CYBJN|nr:ubiquitin-conjugating enzyme E2 [Cyberlindnera jadinii NRRL Y-1542]ODV72218.1 ubiquitin-conjugating enzyme E2 [Cyberlindnera jadinii NRRL Y-1542]